LDLIDINYNTYKYVLVKDVLIETCPKEISRENKELKQEVARLRLCTTRKANFIRITLL
jgi:hypothetical protein